ncbi:MAG: chorismate mutase [Lachnospiraceae bacterium]|nr:chorismate mutase [Lachnospiraceae bacterium]
MDLKELREKIDETDRQIVALYEQRMDLSAQIASYKIEHGLKVLDRNREAEKIKSVRAMTGNSFNEESIEELYVHIMALSRKKQIALMRERGITVSDEEE